MVFQLALTGIFAGSFRQETENAVELVLHCAPKVAEDRETCWHVSLRKADATIAWSINKGLLFPKPRSPSVFPSCDTVWKTSLDPVGWVICVVCPQFLSASPDEASQTHQQATRSEVCQWPSAGWSQHVLSNRLDFCPRVTKEAQQLPEFGPVTTHWGDHFCLLQWITREGKNHRGSSGLEFLFC